MIHSIFEPLEEIEPSIRGLVRHHEINVTRETRNLIQNDCMSADEKTRQLLLLCPPENLDDGAQCSDAAEKGYAIS